MDKHLTTVAILQIGLSIFGFLIGGFILVLLTGIGVMIHDFQAQEILTIVGISVGSFFILLSVPSIIGGIGLYHRKNWARILILILSAIDLFNIPIGTALGIYSIWVLVQPETVKLMN